MRRVILAVLLAFLPGATLLSAKSDVVEPYPGYILRLIGRDGMAHGCPIAPDMALTAGHVIDPKPLDPSVPFQGGRYETLSGAYEGTYAPVMAGKTEDLGLIVGSSAWTSYFIAKEAPKKGDTVYWLEYDYGKRKSILAPLYISAKVTRVIAGNVIVDGTPHQGASGGCVLNQQGQVVGVVVWRIESDRENEPGAGVIVGVWGKWLKSPDQMRVELKLPPLNPNAEPEVTVIDNTTPETGKE